MSKIVDHDGPSRASVYSHHRQSGRQVGVTDDEAVGGIGLICDEWVRSYGSNAGG